MNPDTLARIHARAMVVPPPWSQQTLQGFLSAHGSVLAVSDAGFALGRVTVDEAELLTLAVDPEAQRLGQGRACLDGFEFKAYAMGARRVFLEVADTNDAARALYTAAGYQEDGIRRDYYARRGEEPIDAVVMSKTLSRP